jgi:hypothetical protein
MILKEATYKETTRTIRVKDTPEVYGCDQCRSVIEVPEDETVLTITNHWNDYNREVTRLTFCSWDCVLEYIKQTELYDDFDFDFIDLPFLTKSNVHTDKTGIQHLIKLLK